MIFRYFIILDILYVFKINNSYNNISKYLKIYLKTKNLKKKKKSTPHIEETHIEYNGVSDMDTSIFVLKVNDS